jgi:hypothetical protein
MECQMCDDDEEVMMKSVYVLQYLSVFDVGCLNSLSSMPACVRTDISSNGRNVTKLKSLDFARAREILQ